MSAIVSIKRELLRAAVQGGGGVADVAARSGVSVADLQSGISNGGSIPANMAITLAATLGMQPNALFEYRAMSRTTVANPRFEYGAFWIQGCAKVSKGGADGNRSAAADR